MVIGFNENPVAGLGTIAEGFGHGGFGCRARVNTQARKAEMPSGRLSFAMST